MPVFRSVRSWTIILGVSLSGYIIYHYLWRGKHTLKRLVPTEYVSYLIGRCGHRIRQVEEETGAQIHFDNTKSPKDRVTTCVIVGSKNECRLANDMIEGMILEHTPIISGDIAIPAHIYQTLLHSGRTTFGTISSTTGVIFIHPENKRLPADSSNIGSEIKQVVVRGTKEQLAAAQAWIEEIIEEFKVRVGTLLTDGMEERLTVLGPGPFEVYISAMVDPSRFWLQIVGPKAQQLDLLVEEMTEFYNDADNRQWNNVQNVSEGDLVAATFQYDKRWYRAEVLHVNEAGDVAELCYVDYGDTDKVPTTELYELKMEYMQLHFQAIECFLARVGPVGETWSPEAVDKFEDWAHVAQWRKLSAKLTNYSRRQRTRAHREPTAMPGVELFDVVDDADFNIGDELVRQGLAVYERSPASSRSSSSLGWERC